MNPEALQELAEELYQLAPAVCPAILPSSARKGEDAGLRKLIKKASRDVQGCALCGKAGRVVLNNDEDERSPGSVPEANLLRFTQTSKLVFKDRAIHMSRGQFACGLCRAAMNTAGYLQLASGAGSGSELLTELNHHFATANGVSSGPDGDEAQAWAYEILGRAYSLQMLASTLGGWHVVEEESVSSSGKPSGSKRFAQKLHKVEGIQKKSRKNIPEQPVEGAAAKKHAARKQKK